MAVVDMDVNMNPASPKYVHTSSPLTELPSSSPTHALKPLPTDILLLSLPAILAHPPNHRFYAQSLALSLTALRRCLKIDALSPESECRAWAGFAEIGIRAIDAEFHSITEYTWAHGVVEEVEHALSKGLLLASKHPSLRGYWHHLSLLQASFTHRQGNSRFGRKLLSRTLKGLKSSDPPAYTYLTHLTELSLILTPPGPLTQSPSSPLSSTPTQTSLLSTSLKHSRSSDDFAPNIRAAFEIISILEATATKRGDVSIGLFARILRARTLAGAGDWEHFAPILDDIEQKLGLEYIPGVSPKAATRPPTEVVKGKPKVPPPTGYRLFDDAFEAAMGITVLILGVAYFTHMGLAAKATPRLAHLHSLIDNNLLDKLGDHGIIEIPLVDAPPLQVQTTHPRILFHITYLLSANAKRDVTGRNPKRKLFLSEGLRMWDVESKHDVPLPLWSSAKDTANIERTLVEIKADLLCELTAVYIMRSEFSAADESLNELVALARTFNCFDDYAPRIALHHAHLAHARNNTQRALACYTASCQLASPGSYIHLAAQAGGITCAIGLAARADTAREILGTAETEGEIEIGWAPEEALCDEARKVARACQAPGMGAALDAIGEVLESCASREIVKSKAHLKNALDSASASQDNYTRAIILALVASYYLHTAGSHAEDMLKTCRALASGLGVQPEKGQNHTTLNCLPTGNLPLGLWVGERFLELYRRTGDDTRVQSQIAANTILKSALATLRDTNISGTA